MRRRSHASRVPQDDAEGRATPPLRRSRCVPREDMRILYYGTLGPQARKRHLRGSRRAQDGCRRRARGAPTSSSSDPIASTAPGVLRADASPGSGLVAVTYRDGHSCRIRSPRMLGGAKLCPRVGYVVPRSMTPRPRQLAARVSVRFSVEAARRWVAPSGASARPEALARPTSRSPHASRPARAASTSSPRRSPAMELVPLRRRWRWRPIARDVRAGSRVSKTFYVPADLSRHRLGRGALRARVGSRPAAAFRLCRTRCAPRSSAAYRARIPRG